MLIGSWGRAPRPSRRAAVFGACIAFIVGQATLPFAAHASTEDFDLLRLQLNSLVGARATFLQQLATADGQVGALLSRDLLQASRPLVSAQSDLAAATISRAARDPFALPAAKRSADRIAGPGLLLGAHVPSTSPPPVAPVRSPDRLAQAAWRQAVLAAPALTLAQPAQNLGGVSSLSRASLGAAPGAASVLLVPASSVGSAAPIAPAPAGGGATGSAQQAHYQALGPAQDLQPARSLQVGGRVVPLLSVAPQSVAAAPPAPTLPPPSDPVPAAARTDGVLPAYARATALLRGSLDSVAPPASLTSQGLDPKERLTSLAKLQASLGHYALSASPGTLSTVPASSVSRFPSAQVSWTFTASTPSSDGGPAALTGSGHANGTSIHDLQLSASPPLTTQSAAPGTNVALSLTPDGAGLLDATAAGSDGTSVRLQVRVEGLGSDPELQAALNKEQLAQAQLSGVIPTGDALYARLLPEYQQRLQIYNAQLVQVMGRNNVVEQAWWARSTARRAYLVAHDQWQARAAAWDRHLHGGGTSPLGVPSSIVPSGLAGSATPGPSASPGTGTASSATPIPALPSALPTVQATPQPSPAPSAPPAASPTPPGGSGGLFSQTGSSDLVVRPGARVAASRELAPVPPTPGQVPLFGTQPQPSPTPVPATAVAAATAPPSLAVDTATATPTPALVPSASPGAPAVASPGTVVPSGSPTPAAIATPVDGPPLVPPGPPPALVPSPGLEPELEALPPPVLPLPGWANAPVAVSVPPHLQSAMVATLNAAGWADISYDQLLADGAMDGVTGYIPPLRGVITTQWGGSTPWQNFHPGLDIATDQDTPVVAAADGYVIYAGLAVPGDPTSSYGNCVMIQHNAVISTLYGHMDMGDHGLQVVVGQQVRQGQTIGYEGATGWATGPHVHFEMRVNNTQFNPALLVSEQQILR